MTVVERTYEARALAIHYFTSGGVPFVDRAAALAVVVDAEDAIGRLREQLAGTVAALREIGDLEGIKGGPGLIAADALRAVGIDPDQDGG